MSCGYCKDANCGCDHDHCCNDKKECGCDHCHETDQVNTKDTKIDLDDDSDLGDIDLDTDM